jgi:FG-GAP repeat
LYGTSVAASANGRVFAVGAPNEDGSVADNANDDGNNVGAVYTYTIAGGQATDSAYLKATHRYNGAALGSSVAISSDGAILAVGSAHEAVSQIGVDALDDGPPTATDAGAVDVLARQANTNWSSQGNSAALRHYVKASNTGTGDLFGMAVGLSGDGNTLIAGAPGEDGNGTNIDGNNDPSNNQAGDSGAAYLF